MSIYVDRIRDHGDAVKGYARRHGTRWSHLFTDGPENELDTFAASIGLKYEWGQHRGVPGRFHYDVIPSKRARAIRAGAIEVDDRTAVTIWHRQMTSTTTGSHPEIDLYSQD